MPIYMDFHQLEGNPTEEDVRQAHQADLAIQEKFGVRFLQYWFNEEASTVFCLIEAPNPEACNACHWSSHCNTACNIQEVEPVYLKMFMGEGGGLDRDMALTQTGETDAANRTFLLVEQKRRNARENGYFEVSAKPKNLVVNAIGKFNGRFIEGIVEDALAGVFDSPINAIRCANNIQEAVQRLTKKRGKASEWNIDFRVALNNGQPLTREEGFFEEAIKQTRRLCMVARPHQIVLSAQLKDLLNMETEASLYPTALDDAKVLTGPEEAFINKLFECTEQRLPAESFNVTELAQCIGVSRPQLYRKVVSLIGRPPGDFIREMRMRKAWALLQARKKSVSEIAYDVGFSSPSYFSKVFYESFGCTPSQLQAAEA